jgi:endonuclease G
MNRRGVFCILMLVLWLVAKASRADDELARWGTPTADYLERPGYLVSFDGRTRCPRWTLEHLSPAQLVRRVDREGCSFKADLDIPAEFRTHVADYLNFGDKGHMACARIHECSAEEMAATFLLSNVCPQLAGFNRGGWRQLEAHTCELITSGQFRECWVVTGPLFWCRKGSEDPTHTIVYGVIGPRRVALASHFYKALLSIDPKGRKHLSAYVLPHQEIPAGADLEQYRVATDRLEFMAGLDLWAGLADDEEDRLEAAP